ETPPPPPPAAQQAHKPPRGPLASEDIGTPQAKRTEAPATPDPPPDPTEIQTAMAAPPPPKPEPPREPAAAPEPKPKPAPKPPAPATAWRRLDAPHPGRVPGPAATRDEYLVYLVSLTRRHLDMLPLSMVGLRRGVTTLTIRLLAIVEEMGEAMLRTSYSQILNSSRDFSTAICDLDGRLIAQAEHVPIHVGALPYAARAMTEFFEGDIHQGDVFLLNDPYHGGNHLPDLTAFVPVFEDDQPRLWSINRAHQSDIGGATHGAYNAAATDIWQEGLRLTPLKLHDRGGCR